MKKYRTKSYSDMIESIEVERETKDSVWVNGRRNAKITSYDRYHESFEMARQWLIERHEGDISAARAKIHRAESALGSIRKMVEIKTESESA
jgi:hypothetical protein